MRRAFLLALTLLAAFAPPATADWVADDLAIAEAAFGPLACGTPTVVRESLEPGVVGEATRSQCKIALNTNERYGPMMRCTVMVHEYGHLAGLDHSDDPYFVMYAYYTGYDYWRCRKRYRSPRSRARPRASNRLVW